MAKVTILGTATTMPTKKRNHPAMHLKFEDKNILFDCGESTQKQIVKAGLSVYKTDYILITHLHADHLVGIFGLLQSIAFLGREKEVTIAGPKGLKKYIDFALNWDYFKPTYPVKLIELSRDKTIVEEPKFKIHAFKVEHPVPCFAYIFEENVEINLDKKKLKKAGLWDSPKCAELKEKGKVKINGKIIKLSDVSKPLRRPLKIVYCMDTNPIDKIAEKSENADLLVCEATFSDKDAEKAHEYGHMTAKDAAKIALKAEAKKLVLAHFSPRYDDINVLREEARQIFKNTDVAEDLDTFQI